MGDSFEPVGVFYNAISPDESGKSAHELSEARFKNLFDSEFVDNVSSLFDAAAGSMPPCPEGWVKGVHKALLGTDRFSEDHMNALMQKAFTVGDGGTLHGLEVGEINKTIQIQNEKAKASKTAETVNVEKGNQKQKRGGMRASLKSVFSLPRRKGKDASVIQGDESIQTETVVLRKVKERQIRNLFLDCYGDDVYVSRERVNGLPLTLVSRPGFAVWTPNGMLMTCEGKNKETFSLDDAIRQCAGYMLIHLFYWLVSKSRLVSGVFGVAVAGANCNDMRKSGSKFVVVLLRLSLPTRIGKKLRLQMHHIDQSDPSHLEDLWYFTNRVCNLKPIDALQLSYGQGCPGLLQMPFTLLQIEYRPRWEMIKNGTANLVFRIPSPESWNDIKQYLFASEYDFARWEAKFKEVGFPCFLKCKNFLATDDPYRAEYYIRAKEEENDVLADLQSAYKVRSIATGNGVYILVASMGNPIRTIGKDLLANKFLPFMDRVLSCQKQWSLVHGDVHAGNVLEDESKNLHLIDYDEARCALVMARRAKTDDQRRVYVETLVDNAEQFTKNQLINLFRLYWNSSNFSHENIDALIEQYDSCFVDGRAPGAEMVDTLYGQLSEVLRELTPANLSENASMQTGDALNVISVSADKVEVERLSEYGTRS